MNDEALKKLRLGLDDLGLSLSSVQQSVLLDYLELLARWNRVFNLTSIESVQEGVTRHLLDCLSLVPYLRDRGVAEDAKIIDVGSGGGLPAVVLSVCFPKAEIISIDAVGKKSRFVSQAAAQLRLPNLQAVHARIEDCRDLSADLAVCRAFSSLRLFLSLTEHCVRLGGTWIAMKGKRPDSEMKDLPENFFVSDVRYPVRVPGLQEDRTFLEIKRKGT